MDGDYSRRPVYHYLRPDGEAMETYNSVTFAVGVSEPKVDDNRQLARLMPLNVMLIHFGADLVTCYRQPSDAEAAEMKWRFNEAKLNRSPDELPF